MSIVVYNTTGKNFKEKDEIIDLVCDLYRLHQQSGFVNGLKLAHRLPHESNNKKDTPHCRYGSEEYLGLK